MLDRMDYRPMRGTAGINSALLAPYEQYEQ